MTYVAILHGGPNNGEQIVLRDRTAVVRVALFDPLPWRAAPSPIGPAITTGEYHLQVEGYAGRGGSGHFHYVGERRPAPPDRALPPYDMSAYRIPVRIPVAAGDYLPDGHAVRFSQMSEEAEREMAEWDAILHGGTVANAGACNTHPSVATSTFRECGGVSVEVGR